MESNSSHELKDYEIEIFSEYILDGRKRFISDKDTQVYSGIKKDTKEKVVFKLKKI